MQNITPLTVFLHFLGFLGIIAIPIAIPIVSSLILQLLSRLFKFSRTDFSTALSCKLIVFGIVIGAFSALSILFLRDLQKIPSIFAFLLFVISPVIGAYVIHKFYGSSVFKSFLASILSGVILLIFIAILICLAVIFIKFQNKMMI